MTTVLSIENLNKRFGGVNATVDVSLEVTSGELHALIGPNGAGKTTLIAQLSGLLMPDTGSINFNGRDITRAPAHVRAQAGLGRSFQITSVFPALSVLENVALAVQVTQGHSYRFWRPVSRDLRLLEPAAAAVERVGLTAQLHSIASQLSHGERRQLEIAMALAGEPLLLLLDEPMAGMGPEESAAMVSLLSQLKNECTILMVEHDMDVVFALADRVSVLVYGNIIATGNPEQIRTDEHVRHAYLGEADD